MEGKKKGGREVEGEKEGGGEVEGEEEGGGEVEGKEEGEIGGRGGRGRQVNEEENIM